MAKMNKQEIRARSVEIVKSAKDIGKAIHTHCLAIVEHSFDPERGNGDFSEATFLVAKLHADKKSVVRADAIKAWFEAFGGMKWGKHKDGKEGFTKAKGMFAAITATPESLKENFAAAKANPWNVYTKAKDFTFFDLDKAIAALIKRAENLEEVPEALAKEGKGHKINPEHLAALKALAA